ncbi:MAG: hypothetical protein ACJAWF_002998, partial [Candidatus Azotimanducaceae bacterium]
MLRIRSHLSGQQRHHLSMTNRTERTRKILSLLLVLILLA